MPDGDDKLEHPKRRQHVEREEWLPPPMKRKFFPQGPHFLVIDDDSGIVNVPYGASEHEPQENDHDENKENNSLHEWLQEQVKPAWAGGEDAVAGSMNDAYALVNPFRGLPRGERQADGGCQEAHPNNDRVGLGLQTIEGAEERVDVLVGALLVPRVEKDPQQEEETKEGKQDGAHAERGEDQRASIGPQEVEVGYAHRDRKHCGPKHHWPSVSKAACGHREAADSSQRPVHDVLHERVVLAPLRHTILASKGPCGVRHLLCHALRDLQVQRHDKGEVVLKRARQLGEVVKGVHEAIYTSVVISWAPLDAGLGVEVELLGELVFKCPLCATVVQVLQVCNFGVNTTEPAPEVETVSQPPTVPVHPGVANDRTHG
mmetsp:Transcript_85521/g.198787  ORF Transcript_85521/g.198787 Transcript_85521/m.198787 type:complete len:374 (+) Transcript_85521:1328-2449(+)